MKDDGRGMRGEKEEFLSRWSRLKREAKEQPQPAPPAPQPVQEAQSPPPELPPLEKLTLESDYRGFFHPKVDEGLRRAALKKLFADPHFNVMDGLDVYIDDYSKSDPLPAAMLAQLRQAQKILEWAREKKDNAKPVAAGAENHAPAAANAERIAPKEPTATDTMAAGTDVPGTEPVEARPTRPAS